MTVQSRQMLGNRDGVQQTGILQLVADQFFGEKSC